VTKVEWLAFVVVRVSIFDDVGEAADALNGLRTSALCSISPSAQVHRPSLTPLPIMFNAYL
jgi:hypothetical protein